MSTIMCAWYMYLSQLGLCCRYFLRHLTYQPSSSPCKQCLVCKYWMLLILHLKRSIRIFFLLYLFSSNSCINHPSPVTWRVACTIHCFIFIFPGYFVNQFNEDHELNKNFFKQKFCVSRVTKQILGFHRKPAVGGSECTEVCSCIKRLKSEVKSSHQTLVKVIWPWIIELFSSIDLQCMCTQSRILAFHI